MKMTASATQTFDEFVYERPDLDRLETEFRTALNDFRHAPSAAMAKAALLTMDAVRARIMTAADICHIRYTIDTRNTFYAAEKEWGDEHYPATEAWKSDYYRALLDSPFRQELEQTIGAQFFRIAELSLKTFVPEILPLLQRENKLSSEYVQLKAKAEIEFEGETFNLSNILTKEVDSDPSTRKAAAEAKWNWYAGNLPEMDRIFAKLVHNRTEAARRLGYGNFIDLGYARMLRTDYDAEKVARFRDAIRRYIVPIAGKLYDQQRKRLGLEKLRYYDEAYRFPDGNPTPQGDPEWIIERAREMYDELAPETNSFFRMMQSRKLMDVTAKEGKATGGYCTYIPGYGAPFIFSNFNGTSGDIDVLTHEFGHAFQVFSSRNLQPLEYNWPTYEACEIHSMSMEFFTYPWMEKFFGPDTEKYYFSHLSGAIRFLPYGVAVDEFQHRIYAEPDLSPAERHAVWREMEEKYLPHRDYDGNDFLQSGAFWTKQNHIFSAPFYYIDYCLAQICAFQFWERDRNDHDSAWSDYLRLCEAGGSGSFLELVQLAGLESPFDEAVVARMAGIVEKELGV